MKRLTLLLFFLILAISFFLRLYRFDAPLADWHSWRQVDTSSVSRVFVEEGFDLLHPRYHDLSNVPSGQENPSGYRFVEFPIYNLFQAGLFKVLPVITLEQWGRMVTIISSLFSITFIFLLVRKYTEDKIGLFAAFLYAILPYNIYYGRVILPDPLMVTFMLGGIYFFALWTEQRTKSKEQRTNFGARGVLYFVLTLIFTASAFLVKPFALFFTLPMAALAFSAFGLSMFKKWQLWLFGVLAILPLVFWRTWIMQFPEGIPASDWLLNGGNIRFKGAFFYWIFENRIGGLILSFWGSSLLVIGILINSFSEKRFNYLKGQMLLFWAFLFSALAYLTIVARGNVQHDYYQILIIPSLVIFSALGAKLLLDPPANLIKKYVSYPLLGLIVIFIFAFGWYDVRDYFNINRSSIIMAGDAVKRLTPRDALVIANYEGDTTFLYQTGRRGWASYTAELSEMINLGADFLVIADPTTSDFEFGNVYKVVEKTDQYIIFNLHESP
jgi:hypothetical protein